jgi:alcohol dehydrogenase
MEQLTLVEQRKIEWREVGDGVSGLHPDQRVIVPFQISCGHCERCARGLTGSCKSVPFLSAFGLPP